MTDPDLKEIYSYACGQKGYVPNADGFKQWKTMFGFADRNDLQQAVEAWYSSHNEFPMPNDLKAHVARLAMDRARKTSAPKRAVMFTCPVCGHSKVAFLTGSVPLRYCETSYGPIGMGTMLGRGQRCGGVLNAEEIAA